MNRSYADKSRAVATRQGWRLAVSPRELAALAAILLACAALLVAAAARPRALSPIAAGQFGAGPSLFAGFNGTERHADGYAYLWTTGSAMVQLRGAYHTAPAYLAELRLRGANPAGPQPLTILAGGRPVAEVRPGEAFRSYRLLLDASTAGEGAELWLGLQTTPFTPPGDARELGVVLTDLALTPVAASPWPGGAGALLALLALWATLRVCGVVPRDALALAGLAGLGLAAALALARQPVVPLLGLGALVLGGVAGAALVARPLAARLGLGALTTLVALSGLLWPPWLSDDAFISFRYAQNLAQGHGLVYNLGERVEGYTNFLWTVLAAALIALGGDVAIWSHLAGGALGIAIVLLTYWLGARLAGEPWGLLAALVAGTSQSLLLYTGRGSGLETGLFTLLLLAASARYLAYQLASLAEDAEAPSARLHASSFVLHPLFVAGLLLALAALTRPEGVMVFALTCAHLALWPLMRRIGDGGAGAPVGLRSLVATAWSSIPWRAVIALAGTFLAVFLPYFCWRLWYYGDLLPNTFYAKTGGGLSQLLRGVAYAGGFALTLGGPLLLIVLAPWLRGWRAALASWRGYLLPLVLVYTAYIVAVGGDHFRGERFFVPLLPWLAILMADGFAAAWAWMRARPAWRSGQGRPSATGLVLNGALAIALAAGAFLALNRTRPIDQIIQGLDESVWIWRDLGWWMADHTPPEASLAAAGAGAVAFYGQRETIDMYGLTDRHIGRLEVAGMGEGVAGHEKRDPVYILEVRRPTYIPRIWEEYFGGPAALEGLYRPISVTARTGRTLELWERRAAP